MKKHVLSFIMVTLTIAQAQATSLSQASITYDRGPTDVKQYYSILTENVPQCDLANHAGTPFTYRGACTSASCATYTPSFRGEQSGNGVIR